MRKSWKLYERLSLIQQLQPGHSHPWIVEQNYFSTCNEIRVFDTLRFQQHLPPTSPFHMYCIYWVGFRHVHITRVASSCLLSMSDQIPLLSFNILFLVSSLIYHPYVAIIRPHRQQVSAAPANVTPYAPSHLFLDFLHPWNTNNFFFRRMGRLL